MKVAISAHGGERSPTLTDLRGAMEDVEAAANPRGCGSARNDAHGAAKAAPTRVHLLIHPSASLRNVRMADAIIQLSPLLPRIPIQLCIHRRHLPELSLYLMPSFLRVAYGSGTMPLPLRGLEPGAGA